MSRQVPSSCRKANQACSGRSCYMPCYSTMEMQMENLISGMLATSVAVVTLIGAEVSYPRESLDATYGRHSVQDETKMEPELDAIAKELQKLDNQICPGC
jgi:hypothetical protein